MEGRYNESLSPLQEYLTEYPEGKSASRAGLLPRKQRLWSGFWPKTIGYVSKSAMWT